MRDSDIAFSKIDHFNENLMANIQGGVIICQVDPATSASKTIYCLYNGVKTLAFRRNL